MRTVCTPVGRAAGRWAIDLRGALLRWDIGQGEPGWQASPDVKISRTVALHLRPGALL
jgi:hypothetical protein